MGRITKQMINYLKEKKDKKILSILNKNKKEVNINGNGTHRYMIKEGINKGKVL
tara:strand:+ start:119 stop:280 length:162 start_codon:yes stop_codon:yes gene_type:complete